MNARTVKEREGGKERERGRGKVREHWLAIITLTKRDRRVLKREKKRNILHIDQQVWRFGVEQDALLNNGRLSILSLPSRSVKIPPLPSSSSSSTKLMLVQAVLTILQSSKSNWLLLRGSGDGGWSNSSPVIGLCSGDDKDSSLKAPTSWEGVSTGDVNESR